MSIELKLFIGLLLAFVSDYIFQTHAQATEKTKRFLPAFIHATIYSLPFLAICWSKWWFVIWISHFFIDRYRLAVYVVRAKNAYVHQHDYIDKDGEWTSKFSIKFPDASNFGFPKEVPAFLSLWLMIIVDNILHLVINSVSIYFGNI